MKIEHVRQKAARTRKEDGLKEAALEEAKQMREKYVRILPGSIHLMKWKRM